MAQRRTRRSDGRYGVNIRLEGADGTRRSVYFYGRTQAEARGKANDALERVSVGAPVRDATRSLGDWLAQWRETFSLASDRAVSTKEPYAGLTLRHVEPVIGQLGLGCVPVGRHARAAAPGVEWPRQALGGAPTPPCGPPSTAPSPTGCSR